MDVHVYGNVYTLLNLFGLKVTLWIFIYIHISYIHLSFGIIDITKIDKNSSDCPVDWYVFAVVFVRV